MHNNHNSITSTVSADTKHR